MPLLTVRRRRHKSFFSQLFDNPTRLIVVSFFVLIMVGSGLLSLPAASRAEPTPYFTALFTATSATCVTGLILVDTASHFSAFGQGVILALIQLGGLGLATITTFFYSLVVKRRSWKVLSVERETTALDSNENPANLLAFIMKFTLAAEAIGAMILIWRFYPRFGSGAIWRGIFQAVSAFCNAGFDLHGTKERPFVSLTDFNDDPIVLLVTGFLIIAGGLGFIVWRELFGRKRKASLSFHARVALTGTFILLLFGTLFFFLVEFSNMAGSPGLGDLPLWQRPVAAFFQSVTTRTAGFNSIDQAQLSDSSAFVSSILMFIGAAPAGTGGGIKVTTLAAVLAVAVSGLRQYSDVRLGRHRIRLQTASRALAIITLSLALVIFSTLAISMIEHVIIDNTNVDFLKIFFEVTSAFGTVGLTAFGTADFHMSSQAILIFLMFVGRVGPASFAIALMRREPKDDVVMPEGNITVG